MYRRMLSTVLLLSALAAPRARADVQCSDEGAECVVSGTYETEGETIKAGRIIFRNGSIIRVIGGGTLVLDAKKIVVNGSALIDGTGEKGRTGQTGAGKGAWSSRGDKDYGDALGGCRGDSNHPDRGGPGGDGGDGGPGATILLSVVPEGNLKTKVAGGGGGDGGPGGAGRLLRNGRQNNCDGCTMNCPSGPTGMAGRPGPRGKVTIRHQE